MLSPMITLASDRASIQETKRHLYRILQASQEATQEQEDTMVTQEGGALHLNILLHCYDPVVEL